MNAEIKNVIKRLRTIIKDKEHVCFNYISALQSELNEAKRVYFEREDDNTIWSPLIRKQLVELDSPEQKELCGLNLELACAELTARIQQKAPLQQSISSLNEILNACSKRGHFDFLSERLREIQMIGQTIEAIGEDTQQLKHIIMSAEETLEVAKGYESALTTLIHSINETSNSHRRLTELIDRAQSIPYRYLSEGMFSALMETMLKLFELCNFHELSDEGEKELYAVLSRYAHIFPQRFERFIVPLTLTCNARLKKGIKTQNHIEFFISTSDLPQIRSQLDNAFMEIHSASSETTKNLEDRLEYLGRELTKAPDLSESAFGSIMEISGRMSWLSKHISSDHCAAAEQQLFAGLQMIRKGLPCLTELSEQLILESVQTLADCKNPSHLDRYIKDAWKSKIRSDLPILWQKFVSGLLQKVSLQQVNDIVKKIRFVERQALGERSIRALRTDLCLASCYARLGNSEDAVPILFNALSSVEYFVKTDSRLMVELIYHLTDTVEKFELKSWLGWMSSVNNSLKRPAQGLVWVNSELARRFLARGTYDKYAELMRWLENESKESDLFKAKWRLKLSDQLFQTQDLIQSEFWFQESTSYLERLPEIHSPLLRYRERQLGVEVEPESPHFRFAILALDGADLRGATHLSGFSSTLTALGMERKLSAVLVSYGLISGLEWVWGRGAVVAKYGSRILKDSFDDTEALSRSIFAAASYMVSPPLKAPPSAVTLATIEPDGPRLQGDFLLRPSDKVFPGEYQLKGTVRLFLLHDECECPGATKSFKFKTRCSEQIRPADLQIWYNGPYEINIDDEFKGVIYAPQATVTINGTLTGAVVASKIICTDANIRFDVDLLGHEF